MNYPVATAVQPYRLPNGTHAIHLSADPDRFKPEREVAWEVYTRFGRRVALFARGTYLGSGLPAVVSRWIEQWKSRTQKPAWVRLVTYKAVEER